MNIYDNQCTNSSQTVEKGIKSRHPTWVSTTSYSLYSSYLGGIYRTAQPYLVDKTKRQSVGYRQRPQPIPPENNRDKGAIKASVRIKNRDILRWLHRCTLQVVAQLYAIVDNLICAPRYPSIRIAAVCIILPRDVCLNVLGHDASCDLALGINPETVAAAPLHRIHHAMLGIGPVRCFPSLATIPLSTAHH